MCISYLILGIYSTNENHERSHNEIVIPRRVRANGDLISHDVTYHHSGNGEELHYKIELNGTEYHLQLTGSSDFIGPGMTVERRKRAIHVRSSPRDISTKCHYRGFIRGHTNSLVALSACNGLVSIQYKFKVEWKNGMVLIFFSLFKPFYFSFFNKFLTNVHFLYFFLKQKVSLLHCDECSVYFRSVVFYGLFHSARQSERLVCASALSLTFNGTQLYKRNSMSERMRQREKIRDTANSKTKLMKTNEKQPSLLIPSIFLQQ